VLTVERLEDGEVSPYLVDELRPGDQVELRGPVGGYFVWEASLGGPVLLVGGGSGVVPLRAIVRHHVGVASDVPLRLLYSARTLEDVLYRDELARGAADDVVDVRFTLTRSWPEGWQGYRRRIDRELLEEVAWPVDERPLVYVCGPTPFVEAAANGFVELGHAPERIRTERFGPTGGRP
jgi:ferredoxin-NADP reductase